MTAGAGRMHVHRHKSESSYLSSGQVMAMELRATEPHRNFSQGNNVFSSGGQNVRDRLI